MARINYKGNMIKDQISSLISNAIKEKNNAKLKVFREIKSVLMTYETTEAKKQKFGPYSDEVELKLLKNILKEHQETLSFQSNTSTIEEETSICGILKEFLPKEASEEDIIKCTRIIIEMRKQTQGTVSMKDMKSILAEVKETYPGADGTIVSKTLKEYI